jgi:tetraacyldisaccharide 4'-kinase
MREYLYNLATDKYNGWFAATLKLFLFILSCIYGLVIRILILYGSLRRRKFQAKVISVGNITLGGTGKTPLVEYICRFLKNKGNNVCVLTRGYRRGLKSIADEPSMLQANLKDIPVIIGSNRIKSAYQAINNFRADTLVLDDGFQQWRLFKDLEIAVIDATNPFGNTHMIPRGILREPLSSLKRSDIFILTKTNINSHTGHIIDRLKRINPSAEIFESMHKPIGFYDINQPHELRGIDTFKGKGAALFSGIGDPGSFEKVIAGLGIKTLFSLKFSDHHIYSRNDLDNIEKLARDYNAGVIITTEKDATRLVSSKLSLLSFKLSVLRIEMLIKDEQRFHNRLLGLYSL